MGQGSSRSYGQAAPALSTSSDDQEPLNTSTSATTEREAQHAISAPSSGKVHSTRLPRNRTDVLDSHATSCHPVSDDTAMHDTATQEIPTVENPSVNQLSAFDPSAGHLPTPPPFSTCSTPTADYTPVASSSSLPSTKTRRSITYNTSHAVSSILGENGHTKAVERQDASGNNPPPSTPSNVQQVRTRRQTLAEKLRNVRRRSFQRLSWGFSGGYEATDSTTPEASSSTADLSQRNQDAREGEESKSVVEGEDVEMTTDKASEVSTPQESESRDPWRILTPPPDEDVMFEERQRARRLVEEALAQLQSELARPNSPYASSNPPDSSIAQANLTQDNAEALSTEGILVTGLTSSSDIQADGVTQVATSEATAQASPPARLFAPLPRRSASRSPSPPENSTSSSVLPPSTFPSLLPDTVPRSIPTMQSSEPSTAQGENTEAVNDLMVPRRILVQGIVSSSPPPSSTLASRQSAASSSRSSIHGDPSGRSLWGELPGTGSMAPSTWERASNNEDGLSRSPSSSSDDDDDQAWENAVSAALGQRSRGRGPSLQRAEDNPARMLRDQANLIGRLLSVAAAATAATLIPGITVNGAPVTGFGESQGSNLLGGAGISLGSAPPPSRGQPPLPSPRPRSDSMGTLRTPGHTRQNVLDSEDTAASPASQTRSPPTSPPSAALQDILRNALAAAFRSATSSNPGNETDEDNQIPSPVESSPPTSANTRNTPDATTATASAQSTSPSTSPPLSRNGASATRPSPLGRSMSDPFGQGTALAIPVASLHSDVPYVSGNHHLPGSFERFLSDLQADVSAAIIRSRESSSPPATATPSADRQATGLEEMRPLLDDIDEVASDTDSRQPAASPNSEDTGAPSAAAPQTAAGRQAFSFFRSYRFSPVPLTGAGGSGTGGAEGTSVAAVTPTPMQATSEAQNNIPPEDVVMDGAEQPNATAVPLVAPSSLLQAEQPATTGEQQQTPAASAVDAPPASLPSRQVVPMLLVGVRSASLIGFSSPESNATSGGSDAAMPGTSSNAQHTQEDRRSDTESTAQYATAGGNPAINGRESGGFVLWILGGLYPSNHPIVIAPSLLGDDAMSYDELLRLAEVLGNVKPPTVTSEEITKSDLKVVKSNTLAQLHTSGDIREITLERCLVCLEDYEADEDIRILNCRHCFHQACVDTWLSTGANTCPACRTIGVPKDASPPLAEALRPAAA